MSNSIIIACPTCAQKYRVSASKIGEHAQCKKCGQRFRIETDQPVDDDTILGWVMEENSSSEQSVMGGTSIFAPKHSEESPRPKIDEWRPNPPPDRPRVRFDRIDEIGAYFEFPAAHLRHRDIRMSFPHRCIHCVTKDNLEVRLIIWTDKLPWQDAFHRKDIETKALGRLDQLLRTHQQRWIDQLEPMSVLPPPYCNPFPYFVCHNCSTVGEITVHVLRREGEEYCQIGIANLDIARRFYHNNGGGNTIGYQRLADAAKRQRDDRWQRLAFPVRRRISTWFRPHDNERFLGYFADRDFSRAEAGSAGVVLTDSRLIFKKYGTKREYDVPTGGRIEIQADKRNAVVRIMQPGVREAKLHSNPVAATHLAKSLTKLKHPWDIKVKTLPSDSE